MLLESSKTHTSVTAPRCVTQIRSDLRAVLGLGVGSLPSRKAESFSEAPVNRDLSSPRWWTCTGLWTVQCDSPGSVPAVLEHELEKGNLRKPQLETEPKWEQRCCLRGPGGWTPRVRALLPSPAPVALEAACPRLSLPAPLPAWGLGSREMRPSPPALRWSVGKEPVHSSVHSSTACIYWYHLSCLGM